MIASTPIGNRMKMALGLSHLLVGLWLPVAQCATPAGGPRGSIRGQVTYADTGVPAVDVVIVAVPKGYLNGRNKATTDENGRYSLKDVQAGEYRVQVSKENTIEWTASAKSGVKVTEGKTTEGVDLALIKGGVISGSVVETSTGRPAAGVSVHVHAASVHYLLTTESDGTFSLRCPPEGYQLRLLWAPKGYCPPDGSETHSVTVRDGEAVKVRRFEIARGLAFVGRVVDPQGRPVSGVRVRVVKTGSPIIADTDARGCFRLLGLLPNSRLTLKVTDAKARIGANVVADIPGEPAEELEIKLLPFAALTGRVVDPEGSPIVDRKVHLVEVANGAGGRMKHRITREDGRYDLDAVPGTSVFITASSGRRWEPRSPTIVVAAGEQHRVPDIIVRPPSVAAISGRVVASDGRPVPGARVRLRAGWPPLNTVADPRGEFEFKAVEPRGNRLWFVATDAEGTLAAQTTITPGQVPNQVVLRLAQAASVTGCVVDHAGEPIPGAQVAVLVQTDRRSSSAVAHATTDARGRYCIGGLPPHHKSNVMARAQGRTSAHSKHRPLEAGETMEIEDLVLATADSFIAGRVTDVAGKPLVAVQVSCPQSSRGMVFTNSQGKYRIDSIPKVDNLYVSVSHADYHVDYRSPVKAGSTNVDFTLTPADRADPRAVVTVGKPVPEPTVETWLNRASLKLTDLRDKVVVIHFWTLYSRACLRSMHTLVALHKQYRDDLAIVAIHDRATPAKEVREFVEENEVQFPVGIVKSTRDDGWAGETFRAFGVKSLPATFLVDKKGMLRQTNVTDDLAAQVKALMAE